MTEEHLPRHPVRFVTAASLFDGHDASINIMRRILQSQGCEVIHLGHDRGVEQVGVLHDLHVALGFCQRLVEVGGDGDRVEVVGGLKMKKFFFPSSARGRG